MCFEDISTLSEIHETDYGLGLNVRLPDGSTIVSTHTAILNLTTLPLSARRVHIFPNLKGSLLSIGILCDHDMTVTYDKTKVTVRDSAGKTVLSGVRSPTTKLWMIDLDATKPHRDEVPRPPPGFGHQESTAAVTTARESLQEPVKWTHTFGHQESTAAVTTTRKSQQELVKWAHASFGSPANRTFANAVNKGFINIPGLTPGVVAKFPPNAIATAMGHLDQTRQGLSSTKLIETDDQWYPKRLQKPTPNVEQRQKYEIATKLIRVRDAAQHGITLSDLTGRFPVRSWKDNDYLYISVCRGANYIHAEPQEGRTSSDFLKSFKATQEFWLQRGVRGEYVRLDNETSTAVENYCKENDIKLEFVPPGNHRANDAERAIRTFVNHFLATLAGTDPNFPLIAWDELLEQAEITLNLMRQSAISPFMSAWQQLHGAYDHDKHPLAPPGIAVVVHEKPDKRASFDFHGKRGYYVGPAMRHHRCHRVFVPETGDTRVSDTIAWYPPPDQHLPGHSPTTDVLAVMEHLRAAMAKILLLPQVVASSDQPSQQPAPEFARMLAEFRSFISSSAPMNKEGDKTETIPQVAAGGEDPAETTTANQRVGADPPDEDATREQIATDAILARHIDAEQATLADSEAAADAALARQIETEQAAIAPPDKPAPVSGNWNRLGRRPRSSKKDTKAAVAAAAATAAAAEAAAAAAAEAAAAAAATKVVKEAAAAAHKAAVARRAKKQSKQGTRRSGRDVPSRRKLEGLANQTTDENPDDLKFLDEAIAANLAQAGKQAEANRRQAEVDSTMLDECIHKHTDLINQLLCADQFAGAVTDTKTKKVAPTTFRSAMRGPQKEKWIKAHAEEFDRLLGTDAPVMHAIRARDKPRDRVATYYNPQVEEKRDKSGGSDNKLLRVRGTAGGNISDYVGNISSPVAETTTVKIMLNAAASEPESILFCVDIKNFYLGTPMPRSGFMRIKRDQIPKESWDKYNLEQLADGDSVMMEITKGIYGLPEAGKLAHERLKLHLAAHGYHQAPNTTCLFRHESRPTTFALIVDDFLVKTNSNENMEHLLHVLRLEYEITVDKEASKFIGMTIERDKENKTITISAPGYIPKVLARFGIGPGHRRTDTPAPYNKPVYGAKVQQLATVDDSKPLGEADTKFIQEVVGCMAWYARTIDSTMLTAVNKLGSRQARPTEAVLRDTMQLLNYAATWPNAATVFKASGMQLAVHSDASYLSETEARSRAGGVFFLTDRDKLGDPAAFNGPIDCTSTIIKCVVGSAFEAEYAALYLNGTSAEEMRNTLTDLGYPQGPTPIISDNQCAVGVANRTVKQKRSKATDMRFHWIRDRAGQGHFVISWSPGTTNFADFFTKSHPAKHQRDMRPIYVKN